MKSPLAPRLSPKERPMWPCEECGKPDAMRVQISGVTITLCPACRDKDGLSLVELALRRARESNS